MQRNTCIVQWNAAEKRTGVCDYVARVVVACNARDLLPVSPARYENGDRTHVAEAAF